MDRWRGERARRIATAAALVAAYLLSLVSPALGWWRCPVAALTGRPCPGCGMTRAVSLLLRGHVRASLAMHPLAVPAVAAGALLLASVVSTTLTTGSAVAIQRSRLGRLAVRFAFVVGVLAVVLWGARGLGFFGGPVPVSALAPFRAPVLVSTRLDPEWLAPIPLTRGASDRSGGRPA